MRYIFIVGLVLVWLGWDDARETFSPAWWLFFVGLGMIVAYFENRLNHKK